MNTAPRRILLVGVARSGTSWLGMALSKAPAVRYYYEPDWFGMDEQRQQGTDGFRAYPMIDPREDDNPLTPIWDMVFAGTYPFMRGGEKPRLRTAAQLVLRLPRPLRGPLTRGAAMASRALPHPRRTIIAKTVGAPFCLEWLTQRYTPRVVMIQRNPLNVVSSWRRLRVQTFDLAARPAVRERYLEPAGIGGPEASASEVANLAWHVGLLTHVLGEAVARHPAWDVFTHEDLCTDSSAGMQQVFARLGLEWTAEAAQFLVSSNRSGEDGKRPIRVTAEQPDRWRGQFNADEVAEIRGVLEGFPRRGWIDPAGHTS